MSEALGKGDREAFDEKEAGGGWWEGVVGQLGEDTVNICFLVFNEVDVEHASHFWEFRSVNFEEDEGFWSGKSEVCDLAVNVCEKFVKVVGQVDFSGLFCTRGRRGRGVPGVCWLGMAVKDNPLLVMGPCKVPRSGN